MTQGIKMATLISYITLILGNLISLIYTPFMLSKLGTSEYGLFTLVNNIIAYVHLLDMGFSNSIIRYNSKYITENDNNNLGKVNGMFLVMYSIIAIIGIIIGGIIYINLGDIFSAGLSLKEVNTLKIMFVISIFNLACSFPLNIFNGIIMAHERFVYIKVLTMVKTILNPIVMVSILICGYRAIGMVVGSTVINILISIVNVIYCIKILKIKFIFSKLDIGLFKEIFKYSFYIFLGSIAYQIYWSTDQIILGAYVNSTAIAIYSLGAQFNTYFMSFSNVISGMFLPKLTKLITTNNHQNNLMNILIKVSRIQYVISIFILFGFILIGKQFIILWSGEDYVYSYFIAILIMVPQVISIIQSLFATMLEAMNKHKIKSMIYLGVSIINLVLSLILVNKFGIFGCAIATAIGMTINAIANNIYYTYNIRLDMKLYWKKISELIIPSLISFILGYIIVDNMTIKSYIDILIFGIIFFVIYFVIFWAWVFDNSEKKSIKSLLGIKKLNIYRKVEL